MRSLTLEDLFAAIVVAILVAGAAFDQPIENVLAAAMVPVAMGLAHRIFLRWRERT